MFLRQQPLFGKKKIQTSTGKAGGGRERGGILPGGDDFKQPHWGGGSLHILKKASRDSYGIEEGKGGGQERG